MEKDMTAGTPGKIIFNFTMPIFIGNIFQQFYNMADTLFSCDCGTFEYRAGSGVYHCI